MENFETTVFIKDRNDELKLYDLNIEVTKFKDLREEFYTT